MRALLRIINVHARFCAAVVLCTVGTSQAATLSMQQSSYNTPRGGVSQVISIVVAGDGYSIGVEGKIKINLAQYDFVQIELQPPFQGTLNTYCGINNGNLNFYSLNLNNIPLVSTAATVCKFRIRPRIAAPLGWYAFNFSEAYSYDVQINGTALPVSYGWINVTP
jgi:hypothetical protein